MKRREGYVGNEHFSVGEDGVFWTTEDTVWQQMFSSQPSTLQESKDRTLEEDKDIFKFICNPACLKGVHISIWIHIHILYEYIHIEMYTGSWKVEQTRSPGENGLYFSICLF